MNTKPFHESIATAIATTTGPAGDARVRLGILGDLIVETKIPKDHEVIAETFKKAVDYWSDGVFMGGLLSRVLDKLKLEVSELTASQT